VHPDFQDRGVASRLVEACVQRARERGIRELFAVTSQTSFFGRLGFATFRREKTASFMS
jgi:N-acetylglutamate synthase-like GNAT family acetyltransferase